MTILLVEDNDTLRRLLIAVLAAEGHVVLDARTGEAAVSLAESAPGRLDLLITDVVLPHLSGYDLVQWTRALHPGIRVIYMSGYLESEILDLSRSDSKATFLQKPFSPSQLLLAIRELVSRSQGGAAG